MSKRITQQELESYLWGAAVLLRGGDKMLLDGSVNGLASLAQRSAGLLSRVQTGSLHLYALLVMVGIVGALLWSWRHV